MGTQVLYECSGMKDDGMTITFSQSVVVRGEVHDSLTSANELLDWQTQYAIHALCYCCPGRHPNSGNPKNGSYSGRNNRIEVFNRFAKKASTSLVGRISVCVNRCVSQVNKRGGM